MAHAMGESKSDTPLFKFDPAIWLPRSPGRVLSFMPTCLVIWGMST